MTPSISVIIPVYNVQDHIQACIETIRKQTWHDFEAIIVDDGSTDRSAAIAKETTAGDSRFKFLWQKNRGLSAARNVGLDHAQGEYIAFVDGDDKVARDFLQSLITAIKAYRTDWVACAVHFTDGKDGGSFHSAIHGDTVLARHNTLRVFNFRSWKDVIPHFPSAWNKLYRRSFIGDLRFAEGLLFEDHLFFHQLAAKTGHILHLPQPLYLQTRGRPGQITGRDDDGVFDQLKVLHELRAVFENAWLANSKEALERLSTRLVFERSTSLRNPQRRARFASAASAFFFENDLAYAPSWDPDIAVSWGMEMEGRLPLSVIVDWSEENPSSLHKTLSSLAVQFGPGFEVIVVCGSIKRIRACMANFAEFNGENFHWIQAVKGQSVPFSGFRMAKGEFAVFLNAGDCPSRTSMLKWCEAMIRDSADFGITGYRTRASRSAAPHTHTGWKCYQPPPPGKVKLSGADILDIDPCLSAKIFRSEFLSARLETGLKKLELPRILCGARCTYIEGSDITLGPLSPPSPSQLFGIFSDKEQSGRMQSSAAGESYKQRSFAREIKQEIVRGSTLSRPGKALWYGSLTLISIAKFPLGMRPKLAGIDPDIGANTASLINPVGTVLGLIGGTRNRSFFEGQKDLDQHISSLQNLTGHGQRIYFPIVETARFRCRQNFEKSDFANLSFSCADRLGIPFHISLRFDEQKLVVNRRNDTGGWESEMETKIAFPRNGTDLTLLFQNNRVTVQFGGWRKSYSGTGFDRIKFIELQGDVRVLDACLGQPSSGLEIDDRLQLRAKGLNRVSIVKAVGSKHSIPMINDTEEEGAAFFSAILPGRFWQSEPSTEALRLEFSQEGKTATAQFVLTRENFLSRLEHLLREPISATDTSLALSIIDHTIHGQFIDKLSHRAQERVIELAEFYGVSDQIQIPENAPVSNTGLATAMHTQDNGNVLGSRISHFLRNNPHGDVSQLLEVEPLPYEVDSSCFLALSEFFCAHDQDFERYFIRLKERGVWPFSAPHNRWGQSALIPFLFQARRYDDVLESLKRIEGLGSEGWLVSTAIAWVLRQLPQATNLAPHTREEILRSILKVLDQNRWDYWSQNHCAELIKAVAFLVGKRRVFAIEQRMLLNSFCITNFGLSRRFWLEISNLFSPIPKELSDAQSAFESLCSGSKCQIDDVEIALRFFENYNHADVPRFRREILGPSETSLLTKSSDCGAEIEKPCPQEAQAALRSLAHPLTIPTTSSGTTELVNQAFYWATGIRNARDEAKEQYDLSKLALSWLSKPVCQKAPALIDEFLFRCEKLVTAESDYIGLVYPQSLLSAGALEADEKDCVQEWLASQSAILLTSETVLEPLPVQLEAISADASTVPILRQTLIPNVNPLFDTLVVVFSCQKNLHSRIPALRDGWLSELSSLNVPYIIVVGDGDGSMAGDTVFLDSPDDYEGLPEKSLEAIRWVFENTDFLHLFKIDDDCFLNAHQFFHSLNYRRYDYYGRSLFRDHGQTDRAWHQEKSHSARGRCDLDMSVEPSSYADGGSGYALSRRAMKALLRSAKTPDGQRLRQISFMEDKLVGDLLALEGISVRSQGYQTAIRRRMTPNGRPVAHWNNSFYPSKAAPVMQVHMDGHHDQKNLLRGLTAPALWPKKVWPSFQDARLGFQSNALELVSSVKTATQAYDANISVVSCVRNEMFMLPHFLEHYRQLGTESFLIADNNSDDGTLEFLLEQPDVTLFSVDTDYQNSNYGVAWQQAMLSSFRVGKWSLIADIDELLFWQKDQRQTLQDLINKQQIASSEAVRVFMLDLYPKGPLSRVDFKTQSPFEQAQFCDTHPLLQNSLSRGPFSDQKTWTSALRHRLLRGSRPDLFVAQKFALLRYQPWMRLSAGMHFVGDVRMSKSELFFGHFKYNSAFHEKAKTESARKQHYNSAEEYKKYLSILSDGGGEIYDPDISVNWKDCEFVSTRLA